MTSTKTVRDELCKRRLLDDGRLCPAAGEGLQRGAKIKVTPKLSCSYFPSRGISERCIVLALTLAGARNPQQRPPAEKSTLLRARAHVATRRRAGSQVKVQRRAPHQGIVDSEERFSCRNIPDGEKNSMNSRLLWGGAAVWPLSSRVGSAHPDFTRLLQMLLRNEKRRQRFKACYRVFGADSNVPSLSLFSGPCRSACWTSSVTERATANGVDIKWTVGRGAWLTTGDAKLKGRTTLPAWRARYKYLFGEVAVFVLPHHGSIHSVRRDVIYDLAHAHVVACAGSTHAKHHPHPDVTRWTNRRPLSGASWPWWVDRASHAILPPQPLHIVSECATSGFDLHVSISS